MAARSILRSESDTAAIRRSRRSGLSPRAYEARLDLCKLWDLVCINKTQAEIAQIMGKDPAWVSRSVRRVQADFSILYATPDEDRLIRENLSRLQSLYAEAMKTAQTTSGHPRVTALRLAADIINQQARYQVTVGYVANRRFGAEEFTGQTLEELRAEISDADVEAIFAEALEQKGWKRPVVVAALELAS